MRLPFILKPAGTPKSFKLHPYLRLVLIDSETTSRWKVSKDSLPGIRATWTSRCAMRLGVVKSVHLADRFRCKLDGPSGD